MSDDEATVQRELTATLERFRGDPWQALGLCADAGSVAARRAFMTLCKQYHPVKFARHSSTVVRLANEVFLAIKRAYETVTGAPRVTAAGTGATPTVDSAVIQVEPTPATTGGSPARPPSARPPSAPGATRAGARPAARTPTSVSPIGRRALMTPPRGTPIGGQPPPDSSRPVPPVRAASPPWRQPTERGMATLVPPAPPSSSSRAAPRTPAPDPGRPPAAARVPASSLRNRRGTTPGSQPPRSPAPAAPPATLDHVLPLVHNRRWAQARELLTTIARAAPGEGRVRGYLHLVRGWEAYEAGRSPEARGEWHRALACDPDLTLAHDALASTGLGD